MASAGADLVTPGPRVIYDRPARRAGLHPARTPALNEGGARENYIKAIGLFERALAQLSFTT